MHVPAITGLYLAFLALLYAVLGLQVSRLRRGNRVLFGDGDNRQLRSAIRAHANFIEYVPILLLIARLLHPLGMYVGPRTLQFQICRVGGISLTWLVLVAAAIMSALRFWP